VREQRRVHALLEARALADEVETEAGPLPLGAHARVGQPERRHQLAPAELGQHPGVDPVGLAGQRGRSPDLERIGDLYLPAGLLELVVHEAGTVHRLDCRPQRLPVPLEPPRQRAQPVGIWRRRPGLEGATLFVAQVVVEALAAEV
jgi:hypothetical protein